MKLRRFSLMTRLTILSLTTMVIVGAGSWYSMNQVSQAFSQSLIAKFELLADVLGESIAAQFKEHYGDVQVFASAEAVRKLDSKAIPSTFDRFVEKIPVFDLIMVIDKNGNLVATNTKDNAGKSVDFNELSKTNYSEAAWFQAVVKDETTNDEEKGFVGTHFDDMKVDPLLKSAFGEDRVSTGFSTAIKNKTGETIAVLTARANETWVTNIIKENLKALIEKNYLESQVILIDGSGNILFEAAYDYLEGREDSRFNTNLVKRQFRAAISSVGGNVGAEFMPDFRRGIDAIAGFQNIDSSKWVSDIGWSVIISDSKSDALGAVYSAMTNFYFIFGCTVIFAVAFSLLFASFLAKTFNSIVRVLNRNAKEVDDASNKIASHATELSQAATEQASALQQTIAAVDEINAMVEKNAESASRSIAVSGQSRLAAEHGRKIVDSMINAIQDINQANEEITVQMDQSNRELSEITKLVNDIGSKTKIINEIVFQTKLLSFNASVEAARAGEYGKGFSVVAEEVGNLARMSGNAAREIATLLQESTKKVEAVVHESKSRMERLVALAKDRVNTGSMTARECDRALEEILTNVQSVDRLIGEIATASKEQSSGIHEISRAITEMEAMTEQNSSVAQSSSVAAEQLKVQSTSLQQVVEDLVASIRGGVTFKRDYDKALNNVVPFRMTNYEKHNRPKAAQEEVAELELGNSSTVTDHVPEKVESESTTKKPVVLPLQAASGSDMVPSADDPGFEDEEG